RTGSSALPSHPSPSANLLLRAGHLVRGLQRDGAAFALAGNRSPTNELCRCGIGKLHGILQCRKLVVEGLQLSVPPQDLHTLDFRAGRKDERKIGGTVELVRS